MENENSGGADAADTGSESVDTSVESNGEGEGLETKAEAVKAIKELFKYKIDGEDVEEEVDLSDKEDMRRRLQLAHAAQKRMAEAKSAKQKAFEIAKKFEDDPESILSRMGPKGREVAEKFLLKHIQDEMMTPEEKSQRDERAELAALRAEKAKIKEDQEKSQMSAQEKVIADDYQNRIIGALEKSGLPKTPALVKRMAKLMKDNLDHGLELSADELAAEAKKDKMAELKAIIADADGDQLIAMFGADVANKIRRSDLKKLKEKQGEVFGGGASEKAPAPRREKNSGPMSMEEWKESVAARLK